MSSSKISAAVEEVVPLFQHSLPEHFILKVESFSLLKMEKYESDEFEVDGHKWRLILYPNGDERRNGDNHISLYLSITDTQNLPHGWEVKAHFTLFVYNYFSDKYLTFHGSSKRFYGLKTEWGFPKLLDLDHFKENSNGYIFEDSCVFGAEVSVIRTSAVPKTQCLSLLEITNNIFSWKIDNFSATKEEYIHSDKFKMGNVNWKLSLYPKGNHGGKGKAISLYLEVAEDEPILTATADWKIYADYTLRIRNKNNSNHQEHQTTHCFNKLEPSWGYPNFLPLSLANCETSDFIVNDTLIVEAEINIVGTSKDFK